MYVLLIFLMTATGVKTPVNPLFFENEYTCQETRQELQETLSSERPDMPAFAACAKVLENGQPA